LVFWRYFFAEKGVHSRLDHKRGLVRLRQRRQTGLDVVIGNNGAAPLLLKNKVAR